MKCDKKLVPYFILGLIVIVGSILRIYNLSEKSLNVDDLNSVRDSENPDWSQGHPPLFFYILHFFMYLGTNEFVLRLPAAIFGVLTILLSFKIGTLFFGTKEGLVCAFLISISTMHIYYSQLVRMYSPLVFLTLLSLFFFYKCFGEKNDNVNWTKIWIGFILSTLLSLYTHYFAAFIVAVEVVFFGLILMSNTILTKSSKLDKKTFLLFVSGIIIIFVLYLPIIITRSRVFGWIVSDSNATVAPYVATSAPSFLWDVLTWFSNNSLYIFYMFLLFFVIGIISSVRKSKEPIILLLLWVALPIILLFLLSTRIHIRPLPRYLIYVLPIYLLIVSRGIVRITEIISKEE